MIGFGRSVAILAPIFTGYLLRAGWSPQDAYKLFAAALVVPSFHIPGDAVLRLLSSKRYEAIRSQRSIARAWGGRAGNGNVGVALAQPARGRAVEEARGASSRAQPVHDEEWQIVDEAGQDREQGQLRDVERPRRHVIE